MKSGKFVCLAVCAAVCLMVALTWATLAPAQTLQRGEIRGVVYDSTHSLVPKAKVTIFNPSTGYKREITTDETGSYAFPQLLPGVYQITTVAEGFAPITLTDIKVDIGASLSLDVTLPVKGQTTSVTVTASTGAVDTATAGINQVLNQLNVENLPLAGRDYRDLAQLSSSAEVVPGLRGGIRLGGQQSDYSELTIDGQDSFNNFFGEFFGSLETKNFTVPLDSVQEFQVVTNGFAPEFGRATGGLINVITKSGTNEWHGSAHYNALAGATSKDLEIPGEKPIPPNIDLRQQFGGTVGFPIHKNTQFLFLATDIQRSHGPLVSQFCTPGPDQATCLSALTTATGPGVFANCMPGSCGPGQVPIPANVSPAAAMLPGGCGKPAAGDSVLKDCYGVSNLGQLLGSHPQFNNFYTVLGHWDWQLSPANHFSIRGYGTRNHTNGFNGAAGQFIIPNGFGNTENFINQGISGVFALNTVLGRKVNEIRVSIQGETRKRHPNSTSPGVSITDSSKTVGPGGPPLCPDGMPCLAVGAPFSTGIGERFYLPINNDNGKFEGADNFQITWGKHDVKFGGNVNSFVDRKDSFVGWAAGEYDFFTLADFNSTTGFSLLSEGIGLGGLSPSLLAPGSTLFPNYQTDLGLYWQDKWQVTPRFTLTYGLRWDGTWNPQPQTRLVGNTVLLGVGAGTHMGAVPQRVPNDFEQFGPRIGMAWNARGGDHPTIVRASWGLYYAQAVEGIFFPTGGGGNLTHCVGSCTPTVAGFPYILPNITNLTVNQLCGTPFGCPANSSGGGYVDPQFKNPRVSNFTVGVEQALARDLTLTVTYAFVHSGRLRTGGYDAEESWQRNYIVDGTDGFGRAILDGTYTFMNGVVQGVAPTRLDPTVTTSSTETGSFSRGNFHEVVVNVTKRFSKRFQVFGNYIWSQNRDNASSERDTDTYFGPQDPININLDYGRNGLDITHQFKAAGVYTFPWGFTASSSVIAHTGVPYPLYISQDITGQTESNNGHEADRPAFTSGGSTFLLGRYPFDQPGFANWDARIAKDIPIRERYHVQLQADFFNATNRHNLYSNPDVAATINLTSVVTCTSRRAPMVAPGFTGTATGPMGLLCPALTSSSLKAAIKAANYGVINQVAPGSTPFAFQAGFKFIF